MEHTYYQNFQTEFSQLEKTEQLEKANSIIYTASAAATATGAIPVPFADAPLLIAEQLGMMLKLNQLFDIEISKKNLRSLLFALMGVGGNTILGKAAVSGLLKFFPFAGAVVGGTICASTAGVLTLALGKAYLTFCQLFTSGKLSQDIFNTEEMTELLKELLQKEMKL